MTNEFSFHKPYRHCVVNSGSLVQQRLDHSVVAVLRRKHHCRPAALQVTTRKKTHTTGEFEPISTGTQATKSSRTSRHLPRLRDQQWRPAPAAS